MTFCYCRSNGPPSPRSAQTQIASTRNPSGRRRYWQHGEGRVASRHLPACHFPRGRRCRTCSRRPSVRAQQAGANPTQYGRALLKRGIAAFDEIDQGVRDIEFLADPTSGELSIGSPAGVAEGIVLAVINRLSRQYPRVVFHLSIATGSALLEQLRERQIEIGFDPVSELVGEDDVELEVLYDQPLIVVAGVENPWVRRRKIRLSELVNEPWTWPPPGSKYDSLIVEAFRANGLKPPRPTVYTHAINLRVSLAATGTFLAVVAASTVSMLSKYPSIRKLPVDLPAAHQGVGIITLKKRTLSPLAQLFIDCAREIAKAIQS